jgi:hypothetical protein
MEDVVSTPPFAFSGFEPLEEVEERNRRGCAFFKRVR